MKNYEYHVLFLESFFNVSLDTRNFYYLTKNSFTFFIIKRKQNLQNKQVETNCWNLKLNTQQITTSCKIKYFSAYLLQSIVIKFILPPFPKNCIKRKFHQTKICFIRSLLSRTFTHAYTHISYCLSPRDSIHEDEDQIFLFQIAIVNEEDRIRYHRYLLCAHRSSSRLESPWERVNISRGKLGSCTAARVKSRVFLFSCKHIYRPRSRFSHVNSARVTSAPIKPAGVVILPRSKLAPRSNRSYCRVIFIPTSW